MEVTQGSLTKVATADAITVPGPLHQVDINPISATLKVTGEQQFTATGLDRFDNPIPGLSYTFQSNEQAGQVDKGGRFTAGIEAGTFDGAVKVEVTQGATTRTAAATVTIRPGPLHHVGIDPGMATLEVTEEQQFKATALDQFENSIPGLSYAFQSDEHAGQVDADGKFTAAREAGTYDEAVTVEVTQGRLAQVAKATVTVQPGSLNHVKIEPVEPVVEVTKRQVFTATALDKFDNPIPGLAISFHSDERSGKVDSQGTFTAGTVADTFTRAVTVEVTQGSETRTAASGVTIESGPLHHVNMEPGAPSVKATKEQQFSWAALDRFDNPIRGLSYTFQSDEQAGRIDSGGKFTAGTVAGIYEGGVTVNVAQGEVTASAMATVVVEHGPLDRVLLSPETVSLDIGESQKFTAQALDPYGNLIPEVRITWEASEGAGTIGVDGLMATATRAGTFDRGVKVTAAVGTVSLEATESVTVNADPPHGLSIPSVVEVAAGVTRQLEAITTDRYGNHLADVELTWTMLDEAAGSITPSGLLTAAEVAGEFGSAIEARATQGELTKSVTTSVNVAPGSLEQIVIAPDPAVLGRGMTQQFVAAGADQFGNLISGLSFTWSVKQGDGSIDANGVYTSGTETGTNINAVEATALRGDITASGTAIVSVEMDRITFMSDREDDQHDIYIMKADGTDVRRLTRSGGQRPKWSPDGRRILHDRNGVIFVMSDDGNWNFRLVSKTYNVSHPVWSPDGTKIVFHCHPDDKAELCVSDVDGGNLTRLTDNLAVDSRPAWSPDGDKIIFVSDRDGNDEIYVMDADGRHPKRLTFSGGRGNQGVDTAPSWSPDGQEILFQSGRVGVEWHIYVMNSDGTNVRPLTPITASSECPSWSSDGQTIVFHSLLDSDKGEIYVMDRDDSNVTRLTTNSANNLCPQWAPPKRGVEVSGVSVVIPNARAVEAMTVEEVTVNARPAVVRIGTDLGSGSGFIIDPDGIILTNNHVIRDATDITVSLNDGSGYTGFVIGRDLMRDLAVVKIGATGLPTLELGDLSQLNLGQQVAVLGYQLGRGAVRVTSGIVSAIEFDGGSNITWVQTKVDPIIKTARGLN